MPLPDAVAARLETWKAKLIDLSRSNRLLHYRHHRASSVQVVEEDPREVLALLAAGKKLTFDARREPEGEASPEPGRLRTGDTRLQTDLGRDVLDKVLKTLWRDSRASIEEQGFNTLFLAMGMLEFTVPPERDLWRAPLLLFPVQLIRRGARAEFALAAYEDEARINPALPLKLEKETGVVVRLPESDEPLAYDAVRAAFATAVEGREGWRIVDELHLAPFSFAKIPLYEDLVRHGDVIGARPIVSTVATGVASPELKLGPLPSLADVAGGAAPAADAAPSSSSSSSTPCRILDADSSQEAALLAARLGHSFVLQGPPGTGKSQTIANAIADALSAGKSVLFVSEKMAALEVVQRRLAHAGLSDFCLELHSHKANKREVVQSLGRAWRKAADAVAAAGGRPGELRELQAHLAAYVAELSKPRGAAGLATHRCLGEAARLAHVPAVPFAMPAPQDLDGATLQRNHRCLKEAAELRGVVEPVAKNPWRGVRRTTLSVSTVEDVRRSLNLLHTALAEAVRTAAAVADACGVPQGETATSWARAREVAEHLAATPKPPTACLSGGRSWGGLSDRAKACLAAGVERQGLRETLLSRYETSVLSVDAASWLPRAREGGGPIGWFRRRRLRKDLAAHAKPGAAAAAAGDAASDLRALARVRDLSATLADAKDWLAGTFGEAYEGLDGDWRRLSSHVEWVRRLLDLWPADSEPGDAARAGAGGARLPETRAAAAALSAALALLDKRWGEATEVLRWDAAARFPRDRREVPAGEIEDAVEEMLGALDGLPDWVSWQGKREEAAVAGLSEYLDGFDARDLESRDLLNGWFRGFYRALADRALAESDVLRGFQGHLHETRIARYRELEGKQMEANAPRVAALLRARVPSPNLGSVTDSEVGILRRQIELQTRHMPTRRLFERVPTLIRTLKPCLMMSPLSVATYLPPDREPFDLVVFDEASQICTEDAIGALARGRQVVVAGDSKQLPPTAFFESRLAERDDAPEDALVDLKSILEECSAGRLPERPLLWHYRSQDESLISFSNSHFYDGSLITFPNALRDPARLGISFVHVPDGVYDPGRTRTNRREAEVVADHVFRLLRERPGDTLGVVTFSTTQRDAVLDAIDVRRRADETAHDSDSVEPRFSDAADEPVFVKNLEAVQGDERDVILFGVGYGRDATGNFLHNFGPLNLDGGERRLNVAVSRARKQMIVIASILPEDIDPARVSKPGARLLRAYLERARRGLEGAPAARAAVDPESLSPLVRTVLADLTARGHRVECNVGESGFRIDLAVRHPQHPDRFALGVLCDGEGGPGTTTTRDRERVRHEVLTRLNWRLHRAWVPDWLRFPDREANRLHAAIEAACREPAPDAASSPRPSAAPPAARPSATSPAAGAPPRGGVGEGESPAFEPAPPAAGAAIPGVVDYRAARLKFVASPESFHEGPLDRVVTALSKVVEVEAPVHVAVAARRLADAWGLGRVTERVLDRVAAAPAAADGRRRLAGRGDFLYAPTAAGEAPPAVRRPGETTPRALEHVAPEELSEAVLLLVRALLSVSEDALVRETARLYGFQRAGGQIASVVSRVVDGLVAAGRLARDAEGWIRVGQPSASA